jgi:hypothetical protein
VTQKRKTAGHGGSALDLDRVRALALRATGTIKPLEGGHAHEGLPFDARRTKAGDALPPYYLVYFLLVELLGFPHSGREEKIAWSIPVDFEGRPYLIEHRKFGLGIFREESEQAEQDAARIVSLVRRGVRAAQPFFRSLAEKAVAASEFNVVNNSDALFERYECFRGLYRETVAEAVARKGEITEEKELSESGSTTVYSFPALELRRKADWLAMAAIDAFFSWTEHAFIHLALLQGRISSGEQVAELAGSEWGDKFQKALDLADRSTARHFNELCVIRRQLRNFIAHGAFGKEGEAFRFHSNAGAVPVILDYSGQQRRYALSSDLAFNDEEALKGIESFIAHLWSGPREAAKIYIQDSGLPLVLTMVQDGTYKAAMLSVDAMNRFVEGLSRASDNAENMDW